MPAVMSCPVLFPAQPPGDGGGEHPGWAGDLGLQTRLVRAALAISAELA